MKRLLNTLLILITSYGLSFSVYADNNQTEKKEIMVKEDLTPPTAEGPLPADQIPPLMSAKKPRMTE